MIRDEVALGEGRKGGAYEYMEVTIIVLPVLELNLGSSFH